MNKFFCLFITLICLSGCNSKVEKYEHAIAKFVQTDKKGVWNDLQFNVIDIKDPVFVYVNDSLELLEQQFNTRTKLEKEILKERLFVNKTNVTKVTFRSIKNLYEESIKRDQYKLDSIENLVFTIPDKYKNKNKSDLIALQIECTFSIVKPLYNIRQIMTETFILDANGEKCIRYIN